MQHADNGYSSHGHFYGFSLIRNAVLIYSPDGTHVCCSRAGKFEGIWSAWSILQLNFKTQVTFAYFMAQLCLHKVDNFLNPTKICSICPLITSQ